MAAVLVGILSGPETGEPTRLAPPAAPEEPHLPFHGRPRVTCKVRVENLDLQLAKVDAEVQGFSQGSGGVILANPCLPALRRESAVKGGPIPATHAVV